MPIVIVELKKNHNDFVKGLEEMEFGERTETIQNKALLISARLLRSIQEN